MASWDQAAAAPPLTLACCGEVVRVVFAGGWFYVPPFYVSVSPPKPSLPALTSDDELDTCMALEALWDRLSGVVHLSDLGIEPTHTYTGNGLARPQHWMAYPR